MGIHISPHEDFAFGVKAEALPPIRYTPRTKTSRAYATRGLPSIPLGSY